MAKGKNQHDTPAMRQYRRFKEQYPECVLFFRMGDFYEMFYEDAKLAHKTLGVTLTQRTKGIPMAGVPYHAVEGYLRRMIQAGHRVAVCEQTEDASQAKGVVKRDVTRVVTPGTLTDESLLEEGRENPLVALLFHETGDNSAASAAWVELSTGAFNVATFEAAELADELARIGPSELLHVESADGERPQRVKQLIESAGCVATARPAWEFRQNEATETLLRQFQVATLEGFGLEDGDSRIGPAGAVVAYLLETQKTTATAGGGARIAHLQPPRRYQRTEHLIIDQVSLRSLEVEQTMRSGSAEGSMLGVLQGCVTAMGKRLLRQWLCFPLANREAIEQRQRAVGAMVEDATFLEALRKQLDDIQDVQRIIGRIAVGRATPRDVVGLGESAQQAEGLAELLAERPSISGYHQDLIAICEPLTKLATNINSACIDAPPAHMREGGLIRDGFDKQLDEYRGLQRDSNVWLAEYQKQLSEQTGMATIKVGYNKVFGYYIELTRSQRDKAPDDWSRKQTLKNAERYITPALKEYEGKVLSAQSRAVAREQDLFAKLCDEAQQHLDALQSYAQTVAGLDVLACFARRAVRHRYVKPEMVDEPVLHIEAGRHPVLDEMLADQFVPNDVELGVGGELATQALITGPNMAGKSTYIRQTALITLLAHTGSFVPADRAVVGMCDRIFTRIGASDELHAGQSTFMVEMTETANICNHVTPASLVILDEIGRGTSTLDGLSLAWAVAEHIATIGCRCLFATHYHEITALAEQYPNVTNLNVTVREWNEQIVFLHRIVPGATDRSYGIHVAQIAGLPARVVQRANELMAQLAVSHTPGNVQGATAKRDDSQMSLFTEYVEHPALGELRDVAIEGLSPLEAFDLLRKIKAQLSE